MLCFVLLRFPSLCAVSLWFVLLRFANPPNHRNKNEKQQNGKQHQHQIEKSKPRNSKSKHVTCRTAGHFSFWRGSRNGRLNRRIESISESRLVSCIVKPALHTTTDRVPYSIREVQFREFSFCRVPPRTFTTMLRDLTAASEHTNTLPVIRHQVRGERCIVINVANNPPGRQANLFAPRSA